MTNPEPIGGHDPDAITRIGAPRVPLWLAERVRNACGSTQIGMSEFLAEAVRVHLATLEACRHGVVVGKPYPPRPTALLSAAQIARQL
jgi:hypothetical protein